MPGGGRSLGVAFEGDAWPLFLPAGSPPYEHPPHTQFCLPWQFLHLRIMGTMSQNKPLLP